MLLLLLPEKFRVRNIFWFWNYFFKNIYKNYLLRTPLIRPVYSNKHISKYAENLFGDSLMNSLKTKLILTSVSELDERTHFFKSWESKDGREKICDVVPRTFAAPYFLGMLLMKRIVRVWLDGATGLNNDPTDFAYIEAGRQDWESFRILVIGTGFPKRQDRPSMRHGTIAS